MSVEPTPFDELLNDNPAPEQDAAPEEPTPEPESVDDPESSEGTGEDETPEADQEAPPAPDVHERMVPLQAVEDERRKRQALEQSVQQLQSQITALQQPKQPDPEPEFLDPEAVNHAKQYVDSTVSSLKREMAVTNANLVEQTFRAANPDYDDVARDVYQAAEQNPALAQQILNAPNPAEYAYRLGQAARQKRELDGFVQNYGGSVEEMKAKLAEELRPQLEEEFRAKHANATAPLTQNTAPPQSLAGTPADASRDHGKHWDGPVALESLIG